MSLPCVCCGRAHGSGSVGLILGERDSHEEAVCDGCVLPGGREQKISGIFSAQLHLLSPRGSGSGSGGTAGGSHHGGAERSAVEIKLLDLIDGSSGVTRPS